MYKLGMVVDLPAIMELPNVCEACMMGKKHWNPFPQEANRAKSPLELVHTYLLWKDEHDNTWWFLLFHDTN